MTVPASAQALGPQANADYQRPGYSPAPMAAVSSVRKDDVRTEPSNFRDAIARASG